MDGHAPGRGQAGATCAATPERGGGVCPCPLHMEAVEDLDPFHSTPVNTRVPGQAGQHRDWGLSTPHAAGMESPPVRVPNLPRPCPRSSPFPAVSQGVQPPRRRGGDGCAARGQYMVLGTWKHVAGFAVWPIYACDTHTQARMYRRQCGHPGESYSPRRFTGRILVPAIIKSERHRAAAHTQLRRRHA